jgi:hypothetical protein
MDAKETKIVLLYFVRQFQPISFDEMLKKLDFEYESLPKPIQRLRATRATYFGMTYLNELAEMGVIKSESGEQITNSSRLVTTSLLPTIQDTFAISLNELMKREKNSITVQPFFRDPLERTQNFQWARIFVAMPFAEEMRPIYTDHILKVAQKLNVSCNRGDDFFTTNSIIDEVWSALFHCDLCIVDCTDRNPNVFYELGIAHTLGRKAVLIAQRIEDIPFDIRHIRVIIYEYTPRGMQEFETKIEQTIRVELGL